MKDVALSLVSVGLWLLAGWMAFNGWIANMGEGDAFLLFGALVPAAAGWWAWPSAGPKYRPEDRKSPWSY